MLAWSKLQLAMLKLDTEAIPYSQRDWKEHVQGRAVLCHGKPAVVHKIIDDGDLRYYIVPEGGNPSEPGADCGSEVVEWDSPHIKWFR